MKIDDYTAYVVAFIAYFNLTLAVAQGCSPNFKICDPTGFTTLSLGAVGPGWADLYESIITSVENANAELGSQPSTTQGGPARRDQAFCCSAVADCLLTLEYNIPMCWDRFTTNVFFPDGTFGAVVTGEFTTSSGDKINLVYGNYTLKDGKIGNAFDTNSTHSSSPSSSLSVPTAWTGTGQGSAIPATELGTSVSLSTGTITVPATTYDASTAPSITIPPSTGMCGQCFANGTTIPGPTVPGGTRALSTSTFTTAVIPKPTFNAANVIVDGRPMNSALLVASMVIPAIFMSYLMHQ